MANLASQHPTQVPHVANSGLSGSASAPARPLMMGYPELEGVIESGDLSPIGGRIAEARAQLDGIVAQAPVSSRASQARKGIRALDLTQEILHHLLKIKKDLLAKREGANASDAGASIPVGRKI